MSFIDRFGRSRVAGFAAVSLVVLALVAAAIRALAMGEADYTNYWGGRVFAPFALLIAAFIIGLGIYSYIHGDQPPKKLRGREARKQRQAENTRFPIDDYKKW